MAKLIGDRTGKSALDEMEEVARARNKDVAEEERLEKLEAARKAKEEAERGKAPSEPIQSSSSDITMADYHGLEWDLNVPRIGYSGIKNTYTYDESLERLKKEGKRHPLPSEALTLLADHLEGKLQGDLKAVAVDMLSDCGEWLSMAVERQGDLLIAYLHPEGIAWDGSKYVKQNTFKYDSKQDFNIADKKSREWIPLDAFGNDFVQALYGRKFADLPQVMREGDKKAHVALTTDGELWPVGRYCFYWFNVDSYGCSGGASRGVSRSS